MVYLNDKKFACESCIKGHRSSSCHHTERPLFEIKKKGRPVSQCEKCRQLRQSKKLHSKCTCVHRAEASEATQPLAPSSTSKTRRFIPIVPALPNGLKDVLTQTISQPADGRQTVDSLLNPCDCKSPLKCKCTGEKSQYRVIATGLSTLAAAAAMQAIPSSSSLAEAVVDGKRPVRARSKTPTTMEPPSKLHRREQLSSCCTLELPPLTAASSSGSSSIPDFGIIPPIKQITSIASGCTCGARCACPGCVDHKRSDTRKKCGDGCGHCVDPTLEFSLPTGPMAAGSSSSNIINNNNPSFLDRFFACAAALPPPPEHRRMSIVLNPMDTTVYSNKVGPPVNLPKLECCGGRCTCPNGQCSCKKSCAGCDNDVEESRSAVPFERQRVSQPPISAPMAYDSVDEQ